MSSKIIISLIAGMALTGCASVTGSRDQTISVQAFQQTSQLSDAICELENDKGKWFITTPGSVQIDRSAEDLIVICRKDGHDSGMATIVSGAGASVAGNVGLALLVPIVGIIGAIVDHNSGATYKYPTNVQVYMGQSVTIQERPPENTEGTNSSTTAPRPPSPDRSSQEQRFTITADGIVPEPNQQKRGND